MTKMILLCKAILLAVFLLAEAQVGLGAARYVAPNGNDSHSGTESQPWKTLRQAASSVQPGDTVRIKAGEYFVGPTWIVNRAGTAEHPIAFQAHGDGEVRITGSSVLPPEKWARVRDSVYSTMIDERVMAVFQNAYPLHGPGDRAKIFSVDDMIPNSFYISGKTGNRVINNIVLDAARSFIIWPTKALPQMLDHNLYHNSSAAPRWERDGVTYKDFDAYQQAAGETHAVYRNPSLVGPADPHPKPGSPVIDAGARLAEVAVDFDGVRRPQGSAQDVGAFEFKVTERKGNAR